MKEKKTQKNRNIFSACTCRSHPSRMPRTREHLRRRRAGTVSCCVYHNQAVKRAVPRLALSHPADALVALGGPPHNRPILVNRAHPYSRVYLTLSFSLSPSGTDRGRLQPSSRPRLMDRLRRDREVAFAIASAASCESRSSRARSWQNSQRRCVSATTSSTKRPWTSPAIRPPDNRCSSCSTRALRLELS